MIILQKFIYREDLKNNPNLYYIFGDNDMRIGTGGQAFEMRGEPNAIGIRVKKAPKTLLYAYYNDKDYSKNIEKISEDICNIDKLLLQDKTVVFPSDGIGTGLARLNEVAPKTFKYLTNSLNKLLKKYGKKNYGF